MHTSSARETTAHHIYIIAHFVRGGVSDKDNSIPIENTTFKGRKDTYSNSSLKCHSDIYHSQRHIGYVHYLNTLQKTQRGEKSPLFTESAPL